jgi:hypothetical protein
MRRTRLGLDCRRQWLVQFALRNGPAVVGMLRSLNRDPPALALRRSRILAMLDTVGASTKLGPPRPSQRQGGSVQRDPLRGMGLRLPLQMPRVSLYRASFITTITTDATPPSKAPHPPNPYPTLAGHYS